MSLNLTLHQSACVSDAMPDGFACTPSTNGFYACRARPRTALLFTPSGGSITTRLWHQGNVVLFEFPREELERFLRETIVPLL
jgi:hypothetical protein